MEGAVMRRMTGVALGATLIFVAGMLPPGLLPLLEKPTFEGNTATDWQPKVEEDLRWERDRRQEVPWGHDPDTPPWSLTPWNEGATGDAGWGGFRGPGGWGGYRIR
jgi:hypothetical protein